MPWILLTIVKVKISSRALKTISSFDVRHPFTQG